MQAGQAISTVGSIPGYIKGSCAWQGKDIQESPSWIVHWTPAQIAELETAADHFAKKRHCTREHHHRVISSSDPKTIYRRCLA